MDWICQLFILHPLFSDDRGQAKEDNHQEKNDKRPR